MTARAHRRLPVWPYHFLALLAGVLGAGLLAYNLPDEIPAKDELQKVSGTVDTVMAVNDLGGQPIGISTPLDSAYFTLEGVKGRFRFPSSFPGYTRVYNRLAFEVDVWVDRRAIGGGEPMLVYQLEQRVPKGRSVEPIAVSYEEIVEGRRRSRRSYVELGAVLVVGAAALFVIGRLVGIWNRHRAGELE